MAFGNLYSKYIGELQGIFAPTPLFYYPELYRFKLAYTLNLSEVRKKSDSPTTLKLQSLKTKPWASNPPAPSHPRSKTPKPEASPKNPNPEAHRLGFWVWGLGFRLNP